MRKHLLFKYHFSVTPSLGKNV